MISLLKDNEDNDDDNDIIANDENDNGTSVRKFCLLSAKTCGAGRLGVGQTIKGVKIILRSSTICIVMIISRYIKVYPNIFVSRK